MSPEGLYVYGVVKSDFDPAWKYNDTGFDGNDVYIFSQGKFGVLVHDCQEKPYTSSDLNEIKKLLLAQNNILNNAMEKFGGVIPLSFNTIIKKGEGSSEDNVKKWLKEDEERLERIWNKIKGKKEYGIRIYYDKDKLIKEASDNEEIKIIKEDIGGRGLGLSYLLEEKAKSRTREITWGKIQQLKERFYQEIKKIAEETIIHISGVDLNENLNEKKDLLFNLSVLVKKEQINKIKEMLKKEEKGGFSFYFAGPFAPYSFVENETK